MNKQAILKKARNSWIGRKAESLYNNYKFRNEIALYAGKSRPKSQHTSILHFSFNKAATQYTKHLLRKMAAHDHMIAIDLNNYAFYSDKPFIDQIPAENFEPYQSLFKKKGYLYSVFGGAILSIPDFEQYKIILMVRDPRDMLVSGYFSMKYSHPEPSSDPKKISDFQNLRKEAISEDINTYVLNHADYYVQKFDEYSKMIDGLSNVYVTKYEDMISNNAKWVSDLAEFCELKTPVIINQNSSNKTENIHSHNRRGVAGDYLEKLTTETINLLNQKFENILKAYNY